MIQIDEQVLSKVTKWLVKASKDWTYGVTNGLAFDLQGGEIAGRDYTACHAWVSSAYRDQCFNNGYGWDSPYSPEAKNFLLATCHSKKRSKGICSKDAHEAIILWLASDESPFSKWIVNKDDEESLLNGGLIILCGPDGATCAQAMWMCKVLRYGIEAGKALDVWKKLYDGGVDPLLALLVCSYVRTIRGAKFGYTGLERHSTVFGGHLEGDVVKIEVSGLFTRNFTKLAATTASVFSPSDKKGVYISSNTFEKFCEPIKVSDGWGGSVDSSASSADVFVRQVRELQDSLLKKLNVTPKLPDSSTVYLDLDM